MGNNNPDPRTSPLRLPLATIPAQSAPLPPTWARYIHGDYPGLVNLAEQLNKFAAAANSRITEMTNSVNCLISGDHEVWSGASSGAFKSSYGQDAVIMNGLNRTITAIASVIDKLAHQLATLEHNLERQLEAVYEKGLIVHDGLGPDGPNFKPNPKFANSPNKSTANSVLIVMQRLQENRNNALVKADEFRKAAAASLAVLSQSIASGFAYYTTGTGVNGTLDPGGLLSPEQLKSDSESVQRLNQALKSHEQELANSGIDYKQIAAGLQKGGVDAKQVAAILSRLKATKPLGSAIEKGGGLATDLAPLILELGGFALLG